MINDYTSIQNAADSIREFLLSCIPNHTLFEFNGIHAVSGNPGSGKTTMIKEQSKFALKKLKNSINNYCN